MNNKLIKKLSAKWSDPNNMPAKGGTIVGDCKPCAQTEIVIQSLGKTAKDFGDYLREEFPEIVGDGARCQYMDKSTAKVLEISVPYAILLRRFNDFSSENPATVLTNPEKILGPNYKRVLTFWRYLETLPADKWFSVAVSLPPVSQSYPQGSQEKWNSARKLVLKLSNKLSLIEPDLYYRVYGLNNQSPEKLDSIDDDRRPYDKCYFAVSTAKDYCTTMGLAFSNPSMPFITAYATLEVMCGVEPADVFFCKLFDYNPHSKFNAARVMLRKAENFLNKLPLLRACRSLPAEASP